MAIQNGRSGGFEVIVKAVGSFGNGECFYAKMNRDGCITLPKLTLDLLREEEDEEQSLVGAVLEAQLEPIEVTS